MVITDDKEKVSYGPFGLRNFGLDNTAMRVILTSQTSEPGIAIL